MHTRPKTNLQCFASGEEWEKWAYHNCIKCVKNSYTLPNGKNTTLRCFIQRDIFAQAEGPAEIYQYTYDVTHSEECPNFILLARDSSRKGIRKLTFPPVPEA